MPLAQHSDVFRAGTVHDLAQEKYGQDINANRPEAGFEDARRANDPRAYERAQNTACHAILGDSGPGLG